MIIQLLNNFLAEEQKHLSKVQERVAQLEKSIENLNNSITKAKTADERDALNEQLNGVYAEYDALIKLVNFTKQSIAEYRLMIWNQENVTKNVKIKTTIGQKLSAWVKVQK